MEIDAIKVAAIKAVMRVIGAPGEPKWPVGMTEELRYEMRNEGLIEWIDVEWKHCGGTASLPLGFPKVREYRLGRNAKEFLKEHP